MRFFSLLVLISVVLAGELKLKKFSGVQVCVPFTIVIRPSWKAGLPYRVAFAADKSVENALDFKVKGSNLVLQTDASFTTANAIKVFVEVPKAELKSISLSGSGNVLLSGAFKIPRLSISHSGSGTLYAPSASITTKLTVNNQGTGVVAFDGPVRSMDLKAQRSSTTYITSIKGNIDYSGSGLSKSYIQPTESWIRISGRANSLATVTFGGSNCAKNCQVTGISMFRKPCSCTKKVTIPAAIQKLSYSCGLVVKGKSTCSSGATSATSTVSSGRSFARSVVSSGSSTSSALAVSSTKCNEKAGALVIDI